MGDAFGQSNAQDIHFYDAESGHWISENQVRLAEIIKDYDDTMHLAWIPPADRANDDSYPFAVMKREPSGKIVMVMKLTDLEMKSPQTVLARIFQGDTRKNDVLSMLEAEDAARNAWAMKQQMDLDEEAREFAMSVLKSPKSVYRHNGREYR